MPKKRGPKTDALEALLKRVDGLEAKLKDKNAEEASSVSPPNNSEPSAQAHADPNSADAPQSIPRRLAIETKLSPADGETAIYTPTTPAARFVLHAT